jgi:hypothetical protein
MGTHQPTCEFTLGQQGPRLRLVLEADGATLPITPVRHGDDIFFLAPDSRVIAALVRMTGAGQLPGCAA